MQVCTSYQVDWSKTTQHIDLSLTIIFFKSSLSSPREQFVKLYLYLIFQMPRNISYMRERSAYTERYNDNFVHNSYRKTFSIYLHQQWCLPPPHHTHTILIHSEFKTLLNFIFKF